MAKAKKPALSIRPLKQKDRKALLALWHACDLIRPWNPPDRDIDFCLNSKHGAILVGEIEGAIVASVMVGHDGHRGWVYYVAADPKRLRSGLGSAIMAAAEAWLQKRGVPKTMLLIRAENKKVVRFYKSLGYEIEPRVLMSKRFVE
ncbi:MAG: GNAT family acetyltransferase [Rhodospirillales bacterium]